MVGRSNEISREICRVQDADEDPSTRQRGTLPEQRPRPAGEVLLVGRERTWQYRGIGRSGPTEVRVPIIARKPCSKTRWSQGEQEGR